MRRRYSSAGPEHKRKLLDEAQEFLGYHRKAAIRALRALRIERGPHIITGRPVSYEPELLLPYLRPIWRARDYACGRRLVAMLPEWIPAYELQKAYGPLRNFFHASLKLERKERTPGVPGRLKRVYGKAQTPLGRVLASAEVSAETKRRLKQEKARLNPFALQKLVVQGLKEIAAIRQLRP